MPAITSHREPSRPRTLVSGGFRTVSPKRPCRICRRDDWCGFSRDERVSICMRVSDGAKRSSKNGGNIHVHDDVAPSFNYQPPARSTPQIKVAPVEVRDAIYRELIRISPASLYQQQLIDNPQGLVSRGLLRKETLRYGALPATQKERAKLARSLRSFAKAHFPRYANLIGIPGVWQDPQGFTHIWKPRDYRMPMLLMSYKDQHGRIQACQLRLHPLDIPKDNPKKYRWLSSPNEPKGTSSGTPIHFTFDPRCLPPGSDVVITEGALKAETLVSLRPAVRAIATSGVSCSQDALVNAARPYNVLIGFDSDYKTNPAVCRQLARLIASRELDRQSRQLTTTTRILSWEGHKGIDEAAYAKQKIKIVSISKWQSELSGQPLEEVSKMWRQADYAPTM
ncbi:MAG: hypothetical protein QOE96_2431 [Blastocatellia bacterium]|nr:hypothetical protein [Blastocatellia bacterium]